MSGYLRGLDGLRAFAILWVMLGHISAANKWVPSSSPEKVFNLLANMGWVGVQLFFVISGFLITKILIENKGTVNQLRNFYVRRGLRIFPVYYFVLIVIFILFPIFGLNFHWLASDVDNQVWFWTYTNNWLRPFVDSKALPHLWSLAIEEQFYLIWPFIVIFLRQNTVIRIGLFMIISAPIFRFILFYFFEPDISGLGARAAYNFTFARWDALALGSILAIFILNVEWKDRLKNYYRHLIVIAGSLMFIQLAVSRSFNAVGQGGFELINQTTVALLFFILVFSVVNSQGRKVVAILEFRALKDVGKYSYALYIFHVPIMVVWFEYLVPEILFLKNTPALGQIIFNFIGIFLVSYMASWISWRLLEHPILRLKKHFS